MTKQKIRNITTGKVVTVTATTNHPSSSYNQAVWVDKDNVAYGQCNLGLPFGYEMVVERNILAKWGSGSHELYSSLAAFLRKHPEYKKHKSNIETYLSRKNQPYTDDLVTLMRLDVNR